jgi:glyoxylase-like metal-dependent hydrolase (beta-lactamase superfamily II)
VLHLDRRNFLTRIVPAAAGAVLAASAPRRARAAGLPDAAIPVRDDPTVTELGARLWMVSGLGGNVVVFDSPEGVLLVDGGADGQAARLMKTVRSLTGGRQVHTLFNTHWHHEQTGANPVLGPAGTRIIAHENTRLWLATDVDSKWAQRTYPRLPREARPSQTFYTRGSLAFGGETIDYGHLPNAHTDGDLYAHFRGADVLVAGDAVRLVSYPAIDYSTNGWITGMVNGLQALSGIGSDTTRVVPGYGPAIARGQLKEQSEMLVTVRQRLAKMIAQGRSLAEAAQARPTQEFDARWGDPSRFLASAWTGMIRRPQELGQPVV